MSELDIKGKISLSYEHLFNKYFQKYSKPAIAFHLSEWMCNNKGYDLKLIKILRNIVVEFDRE